MRKIGLMLGLLSVFLIVSVTPACARVKQHENPVHASRQKAYDENKEVYSGVNAPKEDADKEKAEKEATADSTDTKSKAKSGKDSASDKTKKGMDPRLAELMKEFDKDGDGVISYEEMAAANVAGKDVELKKLLAAQKAKSQKKKKTATPVVRTPESSKP